MIIDLWTLAIVWQACGLIATAGWAKMYRSLSLSDVMAFLLLGPAWLLLATVLWLIENGDKIQLWKQEE